jgi:PIN domain nuclease of toxin-antitoxin system
MSNEQDFNELDVFQFMAMTLDNSNLPPEVQTAIANLTPTILMKAAERKEREQKYRQERLLIKEKKEEEAKKKREEKEVFQFMAMILDNSNLPPEVQTAIANLTPTILMKAAERKEREQKYRQERLLIKEKKEEEAKKKEGEAKKKREEKEEEAKKKMEEKEEEAKKKREEKEEEAKKKMEEKLKQVINKNAEKLERQRKASLAYDETFWNVYRCENQNPMDDLQSGKALVYSHGSRILWEKLLRELADGSVGSVAYLVSEGLGWLVTLLFSGSTGFLSSTLFALWLFQWAMTVFVFSSNPQYLLCGHSGKQYPGKYFWIIIDFHVFLGCMIPNT